MYTPSQHPRTLSISISIFKWSKVDSELDDVHKKCHHHDKDELKQRDNVFLTFERVWHGYHYNWEDRLPVSQCPETSDKEKEMGEDHRVRQPDVIVHAAIIKFLDAAAIYEDTSREGREALLHTWLHAVQVTHKFASMK